MDKNNQGSEEIVVSEGMTAMAFWVVLLTSLSFIGAFMLRKHKTAIVMLLIQSLIVLMFCVLPYVESEINTSHAWDKDSVSAMAYNVLGFMVFFCPLMWLFVWLWGFILIAEVKANNRLNTKDIDKNNQASEEIVVSKETSMMAFYVVSLTSLSFIGAFMLRKYKTAIVMLLIQIFVADGFYDAHHGSYSGGEGLAVGVALVLFAIPLWLGTWLWGVILTAKVALAHNKSNPTARRRIKTAVFLSPLFIIIWLSLLL